MRRSVTAAQYRQARILFMACRHAYDAAGILQDELLRMTKADPNGFVSDSSFNGNKSFAEAMRAEEIEIRKTTKAARRKER